MQFEGIYTPIITPNSEVGAIDKKAFRTLQEFLWHQGKLW